MQTYKSAMRALQATALDYVVRRFCLRTASRNGSIADSCKCTYVANEL
jgi:hypothetical protein